jgi:hypothetical protein
VQLLKNRLAQFSGIYANRLFLYSYNYPDNEITMAKKKTLISLLADHKISFDFIENESELDCE